MFAQPQGLLSKVNTQAKEIPLYGCSRVVLTNLPANLPDVRDTGTWYQMALVSSKTWSQLHYVNSNCTPITHILIPPQKYQLQSNHTHSTRKK